MNISVRRLLQLGEAGESNGRSNTEHLAFAAEFMEQRGLTTLTRTTERHGRDDDDESRMTFVILSDKL